MGGLRGRAGGEGPRSETDGGADRTRRDAATGAAGDWSGPCAAAATGRTDACALPPTAFIRVPQVSVAALLLLLMWPLTLCTAIAVILRYDCPTAGVDDGRRRSPVGVVRHGGGSGARGKRAVSALLWVGSAWP